MKKNCTLLAFTLPVLALLFSLPLFSQDSELLFVPDQHLSLTEKQAFITKSKLEKGTLLQINDSVFDKIKNIEKEEITFSVPFENGQFLEATLHANQIFTDDFTVVAKDGIKETTIPYEKGLHYFGTINGDSNTIAGFSFFEDKIMGIFTYNGENYNLEKTTGNASSDGQYILYRQKDFQLPLSFNCHTSDEASPEALPMPPGFSILQEGMQEFLPPNVNVYFECDYKMYQDNGNNVATTVSFTAGLFNVVAGIYANAGGVGLGPTMLISQTVVWTMPDPYGATTATTSSEVLSAFSCLPSYNGRIAHLLSTSTQNLGGLANRPSCPASGQYSAAIYGFSNIYNFYDIDLNNYSWSVDVLAHELGHNMSSHHTHACVWNGNNTQIDDCGNVAADNAGNTPEGNACFDDNNPILPAQGKIMSYCHLINGVGIDLADGFETQVGNRINTFAACLSPTISCVAAATNQLSASNLMDNSARLNCSVTQGISWYNFRYREVGSNTWTNSPVVSTNYYDVAGLQPDTDYEFNVALYCSSGSWSSFSCSVTFTTTDGACPATLAVNDNPIQSGTYQASGLITSMGLVDNGTNVVFDAGTGAELQANFQVQTGGIFEVIILGCMP